MNESSMTSLHADEAYLSHYQFSHDPFAARVPGFKFFPAQRKPVLGQLHHLARYSQLLLVVSGPHGSGKTLLRQALVASTNKQAVQSVVVTPRNEAGIGLVQQIAQGLGVASPDPRAILAQVAQLALTGQEVYLLVDDAEELDDAALELLLSLAAGNAEGRPHVFLFGEPSVVSRLERLSEDEERFHAIDLQPYEEEETREYLAQRLEGAGRGLEILSDGQIAEIHHQSGGWPGGINQVARDVLIEAMLAQRGSVRRSGFAFNLPKKHLLALVVVSVGVGAAWLMQGQSDKAPEPTQAQLPLGQTQAPVASTEAPAAAAPSNQGEAPAIEFAGSTQPLPLPLVGEAQPVIRSPLAEAAGQADDEEVPGATIELPPSSSSAVSPVDITPPATPVPAPAPTPVQSAPLPPPSQPIAAVPPAQPAKPAPAPAPAAPPAPKPAPAPVAAKPAVSATVAGGDWYRAQAGSRYALQVLGTRSENSAKGLVSELGGQYHYFKKMHQGQPLYVVTYGSFDSRNAAQAAIKGLPAKVQAGKPWPRSFASIQQEMAR